jgi:hypothetical protein
MVKRSSAARRFLRWARAELSQTGETNSPPLADRPPALQAEEPLELLTTLGAPARLA